ncbi:MAG: hypothetical protein LBQ54_02090 [Planctomycetaceae bacterium]|jgi:hypothetical protein|nr:hypothetical protein [Planctomycetaceae bacterium]
MMKKRMTPMAAAVLTLPFLLMPGCDRPEAAPESYGKIVEQLPDLPEAKEPYKYPATYEPEHRPGSPGANVARWIAVAFGLQLERFFQTDADHTEGVGRLPPAAASRPAGGKHVAAPHLPLGCAVGVHCHLFHVVPLADSSEQRERGNVPFHRNSLMVTTFHSASIGNVFSLVDTSD